VAVEIVITKADGTAHDRTLLVDGRGARVAPVHVVHDLPHLVVESIFGIDDGLWGELADGRHDTAARAATARHPRKQKLGRIVSGAADGAPTDRWLTEGHRVAKAVTNAVANRFGDGPDDAAGVRARLARDPSPAAAELLDRLDDEVIERAIDAVRRMDRTWAEVAPGGTLRLTWPLDHDTWGGAP